MVNKSKKLLYCVMIAFSMLTIFGMMYYASKINYLIFHTLIELSGAVVCVTIFSIGWNTRAYSKNSFMTILAVGYLVVGVFTVFHTLSYNNMNVFSEQGTNIPVQFWIISRYLESITMLIALFYLKKKRKLRPGLTLILYSLIGLLLVISIFAGVFPKCYIEGKGLTFFKIISEYIICSIFLYTEFLLIRLKDSFEKVIYERILASIVFSILSDLCFTLYKDPYGFTNLLGHFFMIISILLIYLSLVQGNLARPYKSLFKYIADYADELADKNKELDIKDKAISSSLNAIVLTDSHANITHVNESLLDLMSYTTEDVLGRSLLDFLPASKEVEKAKKQFRAEGSWYGEILLKKKDGNLICVLLTANTIYTKQGEPFCYMASFLDISERKSIEEELIRAKNDAEAANIAKSNFLANMSHEIRTPMNGILGFLQLLEVTRMTREQLEYINNIKASTDTLLTIINDILDVSKIEAGKMDLERVPFDLSLAIENAVISFAASADEKGLDLNMLIRSDVPRYTIGDPIRLRQVISNLINNAVKFTNTGYVLLEVSLISKEGPNALLQFKIEDTGIGISKEAAQRLFKPFTQVDATSSRRFGGTGLGLAICNSFIELMGGNIRVDSTEGKGSRFIFTITLEEVPNEKPNQDADYSALKGKRIMLVDDQAMNRNVVRTYLQEAGSIVEEANSLSEGIWKLGKSKGEMPYAVIIDDKVLKKEESDVTALQELSTAIDLPMILVTSYALRFEDKKVIGKWFSGYLSKPTKRDELLYCVATAVSGKINPIENEDTLDSGKEAPEADLHNLKVLLVEDNEINRCFFEELLKIKGIECDIASDGEEAVNICLRKDYDIIFMDCQMPVVDGYEATKIIREAEGDRKHTVIIAMTANAMKIDAEKCLNSGMDDYLSKPVDINQVAGILKKHITFQAEDLTC